jgi:type II secretion system protein I
MRICISGCYSPVAAGFSPRRDQATASTRGLRHWHAARRGLSLLEVLVALTIFLFALIAISKLIDLGSQTAVEMDLRSQGASLAQSKLSEVIAGVVPLSSQSESPFDNDSDWVWTLDAEQDDIPGLYRVKIVVSHDMPTGKVQVTLAQYVLDPNSRGSTEAP